MRFIKLLKFLLILILSFLIFLLVLNFTAFDKSFYQKEFSEQQIQKDVPEAISLHEKVIDFIKGKSNELPDVFNDREKKHLWAVRNIINNSTIMLYILIILFALLLAVSAFILKINDYIINFAGKVLLFGGFLTVIIVAILFFLIVSDFSSTFESFHTLFFEKSTYMFDPAKEIIVNLYPEQIFIDLGIRISKAVFIASFVVIIAGLFLTINSKSKKNKNTSK